jgi:hypothetical protein
MATNWGGALSGAGTGAAVGSVLGPWGTAGGAILGGVAGLFSGGSKKPKIKPQSTLRPGQEPLYEQAVNAGLNPGAGGAFGDAADYYRSNLGNNPADFNAFAAPALRQYNEDIAPGLAEQYAGMGGGGQGNLSSSGFRNAQIQGATDLAERLGALRANLRQQSAQGLMNIGNIGLRNYSENVREMPQAGFAENAAEGIGQVLPSVLNYALNSRNAQNSQNKVGQQTGPYGYGNVPTASPRIELPKRAF